MILQRVIGNIYSIAMEILLWLLPIVGFIALGIFMAENGSSFNFGYACLGLLSGLVLDVILFGPVIITLNMRSSLENINKNIIIINDNMDEIIEAVDKS